MTPVCPACRAAIGLDAHACARCGLAVRPTCARCGEPLMFGMAACWFCREPIEVSDDVPRAPVPVHVSAASAMPMERDTPVPAVAVAPPVHLAPPHASVPVFPVRRRVSFGRALFTWFAFALVLTLTLLAAEMFMPRFGSIEPAALNLENRAFPDLGFSISYPADWHVAEQSNRVSFRAAEAGGGKSTRGLRVSRSDLDLEDVAKKERLNRRRFDDLQSLGRRTGRFDGEDALAFVFVGNELRIEQWWVDAGKDTLRVEFWSRPADENAAETNDHIVRTLRLL